MTKRIYTVVPITSDKRLLIVSNNPDVNMCGTHTEAYMCGYLRPRYPVPALRRDICYWDCGGISINTVGEVMPSYTYGKAFGNGVRMNPWEP